MDTADRRLKYLGFRPYGDLADVTAYTKKGGKTVWFVKSPPTKPPTFAQRMQRALFTAAAEAWAALSPETRNDWNLAACRAHLYVHGYNLWIFWQLVRDRETIRTIERQAAITLLRE